MATVSVALRAISMIAVCAMATDHRAEQMLLFELSFRRTAFFQPAKIISMNEFAKLYC